jgi:superfamily II DNA or RNA helicase
MVTMSRPAPPHDAALRPWQRDALDRYGAGDVTDFLVTATPGAGKTTFALTLAARLLARRVVDRIIVVCPTDHLRTQWADAAADIGLVLDPTLRNADGPVRADAHGYVTTYAQVAGKPAIHAARSRVRRTLVVLDEIHHAADGLSWGAAVAEAFDEAHRRVSLTGTPFRTRPDERIPFVEYRTDGDLLRSVADHTYGYREALADGVVRPVVFAAYTGVSRWRNSAGEVIASSLAGAGTASTEAAAWKAALDPSGGWVPHVLAAMDERISHLRDSGMPDAAGIVLAGDQEDARAYAGIVHRLTGQKPALILSDDPKASRKIDQFRASDQRMAVCVRMISEGVDIPRAACLAWMTSYRTPLFFAQAVGRVVRARAVTETATVFLPAVRPLLALAAELEEDRDYVLAPPPPGDSDGEINGALDLPGDRSEPTGSAVEVLDSEAEFAHVLHSGRAVVAAQAGSFALTEDEEAFLGLPGLLSPEQTASLLAGRDAELRRRATEAGRAADPLPSDDEPESLGWREAAALRREVNRLVGQVAARTGTPHAQVHGQLRRAVPGPPYAAAAAEVLERRRDHLLGLL